VKEVMGMNQKDWLEVAIRILGVYVLFCAVTYFAEAWLMYADYSRNPDINFRYYFIHAWIDVLVGLIFLRAPGVLSNLAYPAAGSEEGPTSGVEEEKED
jgi:hypothetical protein